MTLAIPTEEAKTTVPLGMLRCPATQEPVEADGDWLCSGERRYPIIDGIPILVDENLSPLSVDEIQHRAFIDKPSYGRRLVRRLIPKRTPAIGAAERYRAFRKAVLESNPGTARVLIVGGGILGEGVHELVDQARIELIETDVYLGPRVAIVCDGHYLPFADETFDGVVVQAVLEHVLDPARVVSEIHRVLKPRGVVYAETPFMQQVHEGPYDFTRWTETGHRRLFRMFEALDTGVTAGPATALLWSLCYFVRSLPRRRSQLQLVLEKAVMLAFFWLPRLDYYLVRHEAATDGASGVYFLGTKHSEPVADIDVLMHYRGTIARPVRRPR
jgi:SAM-dependent methyltransferase